MNIDIDFALQDSNPEDAFNSSENYLYSGSGSLAQVYVHENIDIAIKIIRTQDEGFAAYVEAIKQSKYNPFYPIIHKKITNHNGREIYIMEKLYNVNYFYDPGTPEHNAVMRKINRIIRAVRNRNHFQLTDNEADAVDTVILALLTAEEMNDVCIDLHPFNFMMRDKDTLVITDPICDNIGCDENDRGSYYWGSE